MTVGPRSEAKLDEKSLVKSLFKALAILECFSPETPELSVAELSSRTGVQKATCNRMVATMAYAGWLTRTTDNRYAPTAKLFRLGTTAIQRLDIRAATRPWLEGLAAKFGDTAYLMIPDGTHVVCLDRAMGSNPLQFMDLAVGMSLPFNVGAGPVAMLAYRDDLLALLDASELAALTEHSASSLDTLASRLASVRERGYAVSREDFALGVAAVGAPVFDRDGTAIAAVSLGGVASGFTPPRLEQIIAAVVEAASDLSRHLGYEHAWPASGADTTGGQ